MINHADFHVFSGVKKSEFGLHRPVETFLDVLWPYDKLWKCSPGNFLSNALTLVVIRQLLKGPTYLAQKSSFHCPKKNASFKKTQKSWIYFFLQAERRGFFFFGQWNELFWQSRLGPSRIIVWPRELVRLIGNCLEIIFIMYHMVIRHLEKFLRTYEVQLEPFDF